LRLARGSPTGEARWTGVKRCKGRVDQAKEFAHAASVEVGLPTLMMKPGQGPERLRRLLRAKDRMDAASDEAWPVRRLAQVSGVSEAHFARSFKDAFGVPPHRYLLTRRIERAKALLRDTDLPIIEIALQTGWDSLGTFGRTFRDVTGESPSALRARAKIEPHALEQVPACYLIAADRPGLTIAVSEKRRRAKAGINGAKETEAP
jgi:AraC-like DNA-binding protein